MMVYITPLRNTQLAALLEVASTVLQYPFKDYCLHSNYKAESYSKQDSNRAKQLFLLLYHLGASSVGTLGTYSQY